MQFFYPIVSVMSIPRFYELVNIHINIVIQLWLKNVFFGYYEFLMDIN